MPAADWTSISNGSGTFVIVADATAPSPPDAMQITNGGQLFQNITAGTFKDSRISAWLRQTTGNSNASWLILRSLNTTFSAAPATYFLAIIYAESATTVNLEINAVVNGVTTIIVSGTSLASVNGNPINTWQQFQFSTFNSGTDILLRISQWNGAVFVPLIDAAAPIASFPSLDAAGRCRFGGIMGSGDILYDDVTFYSLT